MKSKLFVTVAGLALAASIATASRAAPADQAPDATKSANEVVVTAQKRTERLHDVPTAIQAYSEKVIEDQNIHGLNQLVTSVPGASEGLSQDAGDRQYQIRGLIQSIGDSTVGYYIGDSAYSYFGTVEGYAPAITTFDLNRVEVLRGPSGTLYGAGAMGGVIRFLPNEPNLRKFEAHAREGVSSTEGGDPGWYTDLAVSVPLIKDVLAVRLVGSYDKVGGYADLPGANLKNVNDADLKNGRVMVEYRPTDKLEIKATYFHDDALNHASALLSSLSPPIPITQPGDHSDSHSDLYTATLNYDFGFATFSDTATGLRYRLNQRESFLYPIPGGLLSLTDGEVAKTFNDEARLVSKGGGPFKWVLGAFYADETSTAPVVYAPAIAPASVTKDSSRSYSVYGEASYGFLDGKLTPLVGLRYFNDRRSQVVTPAGSQAAPETFDSVDPRFNLSWKPTTDQNYYVNIAEGFRSGIFNSPDICQGLHRAVGGLPCQNAVPSDSVWSYEAGTKQNFLERQISIDLDAYYEDWRDVQYIVPFFGLFQTYQIGTAHLYGVEGTATYAPAALRGFKVAATFNWNSSKFAHINPTLAAASGIKAGSRIPFVPDVTLSIAPSYEWSLGVGDWRGLASGTFNHISPQLGQIGSTVNGSDRNLLGLRVGARNGRWGAYLFGNNLLDEKGAIYAQAPAAGLKTFTQDYPRQIGFEVTADF